MADMKAFRCIRPVPEKAAGIAALPYDVYNREEAKKEIEREPLSFLRIDRAETQLPDEVDTYDERVYQRANAVLQEMIQKGDFLVEQQECYYIYELTMENRVQDGLVVCASIDDYVNGTIKKHEQTRADKEQDRIRHVDYCNAQTGPIFLAYRYQETIDKIIKEVKQQEALYDFTSPDGIRHRVFQIYQLDKIEGISRELKQLENIYIADGHHRAASAVKVGLMRRERQKSYTGREEFNYVLSILFPDNQLKILDYNRVVKDLNGYTVGEFLAKVFETFLVEQIEDGAYQPREKGEFTMFLDNCWYRCRIKEADRSSHPIEGLDVSILQNKLLEPMLGIKNPREDKRIDFVGGIRGLRELEERVKKDCKVAFAMYPTAIEELFAVADAGMLMPPKSTWFEPKLRSGLFIHEIDG